MNTKIYTYYTVIDGTKEWETRPGRLQTYCEETQTFDEVMFYGGISELCDLTYQETSFGLVYESLEGYDLWVYTEEGGSERILAEDVCSFYTVGEQIYYVTSLFTENDPYVDPYVLRVFDWDRKTDTVICEWTDYANIAYFIVEDNYIIFVASQLDQNAQSVYRFDLSNPEQKEKAIYTIDPNGADSTYIHSWNVWDGTVYLCTEKGLIACDIDTGAYRELCDREALRCDIVDDTWVYFMARDSKSLWRVPQSGGNAELVLG